MSAKRTKEQRDIEMAGNDSRELGSDGSGIIMQLVGAGRNMREMTHILQLPLVTQLGTAL